MLRKILRPAPLVVAVLLSASRVHAATPIRSPHANGGWDTDIDFIASELPKRHPDPFTYVTAAEFNAQLNAIKAKTASLSNAAVAIEIQKAIASLRDAHTEIDTRVGPMTFFPLRLYDFEDGLFVTRTNAESRAACGTRLVAINGIPAAEVFDRVAPVVSAENREWLRARVPFQMVRAEVLASAGVTGESGPTRFTFESSPGARFDLTLNTVSGAAAGDVLDKPYAGADLPLYLQHPELNYWYTWDANRGLLYLKYNVCADDPRNRFENVAREMYAIVREGHVAAFVIDLRNNTGGSDAVLRPLIDALPATPQLVGRVYAIIGRDTFSSAMLNAIQLRAAGARLAGENTGGKPNSFGEVRSMPLPVSGLTVYYSTRFIHAVDEDVSTLQPDLAVALTSADFFARRDPVLDAILQRTAPLPLQAAASSRRRAVSPVAPRRCPD